MLKFIDKFLNETTMYRVALYHVSGIWAVGFISSLFGLVHYKPLDLLVTIIVIQVVCLLVNAIFAHIFEAPSNIESVYITGFILALIVSPAQPFSRLAFLGLVAALAMASKYIIAINKKHIFNPAALAVAVVAVIIGQSANWWIGNLYMAPFVLLGGVLMIKKIRRLDLVLSFFVTAITFTLGYFFFKSGNIVFILKQILFDSPVFFFACVMLTEPMTTPPTRNLRILYGILTGFLFAPFIHIGSLYFTPELALLAGNIFVYVVSPKYKFVLELKEKVMTSPDTYDFLFAPNKNFVFQPGQYMEWTLGHKHQDSRGMRRYFTIASSPAEEYIRMGIKFFPNSSTFKQSMLSLNPGDKIVASQLAGDFILPKNKDKKLAFIAGGIGITPFRSMIKHLLDINQKRDIIMLFSSYAPDRIVYRDVFDQAEQYLGIKTIYNITTAPYPDDWQGEKGIINEEKIRRIIPDFLERDFYLSGSHSMVVAFDQTLQKMGVKKSQIKKDFFPGLA